MYYNSLGAPNYCTQNNYDTTPRFSSLTFFRPGHVRFANCCLKPGRMPLPKALCGPWEGLQTSPKRRPKMGKLVPKISSKPTWYPLVNDHIAIAETSPIFNRKIIDSGPPFSSQLCDRLPGFFWNVRHHSGVLFSILSIRIINSPRPPPPKRRGPNGVERNVPRLLRL